MLSCVTSEIWQDQFLESISCDIFSESDHLDVNSNDKVEHEASKDEEECFVAKFIAEKSRTIFQDFPFLENERLYGIECLRLSTVDLVGLQVWRGALLLADYILSHPHEFHDKEVLELAAGTGITSIVVSELAKNVTCSDVNRGQILSTIRRNFELNSDLVRSSHQVVEIDFYSKNWREDLLDTLSKTEVVLVADVVYDPNLTEKFFTSLKFVIQASNKPLKVYFAIEKRNRVDQSGAVSAPNYDHFELLLRSMSTELQAVLKIIKVDFEQRLKCYERVNELFMWKLIANKSS